MSRVVRDHIFIGKPLWLAIPAALVLAGCIASNPPLPPLINGVSAGGGWDSACPALDEAEQHWIQVAGRIADSPELEQRLRTRFPPGTSNDQIVASLLAQGLTLDKPCASDQTIKRASFSRKSGDVSATIYWKLDEQHRVVWTKGIVMYISL